MADDSKSQQRAQQDARKARQAAELRANLKKRKALAREKASGETASGGTEDLAD